MTSPQSAEQDQAAVQCGEKALLGTAGGWWVTLGCHLRCLELAAGVSGVVCVHGLGAEDVSLDEVAACYLLKSVLILSPLHLAWFHRS